MELIIKKQIGKRNYNFVFQGKDLHEVVMESENLSFPDVEKCGLCGSSDIYIMAYEAGEKKYKYVKIACKDCRGSITFGKSKKNPNQYFLRKTDDGKYDWQKFVPKDGAAETVKKTFTGKELDDSSIPF